jgi:hypothetical protein
MLRLQSRKTLYLDGGRLLGAPTDWRILCRPQNIQISQGEGREVYRRRGAGREGEDLGAGGVLDVVEELALVGLRQC